MMRPELIVLDGDSISYIACAASEQRFVEVTRRAGKPEVYQFKNRTEFKLWAKERGEDVLDYTLVDVQVPEAIENTLHTMKMMIKGHCDRLGCENYVIGLSGENNFREALPLPRKYKGDRDTKLRPLNLKLAQEYLIKHHAAVVVDGEEADDWQAQYQYRGWKEKRNIVVVSIDKDARQTPGWLYNPDSGKPPKLIEGLGTLYKDGNDVKGYGRLWLAYQTLIGDATDDYDPRDMFPKKIRPKYGPVAAYNQLVGCTTDKEAWAVIAKQYKEWFPEPITYTAWDGTEHTKGWIDILQMYFLCAHMRRWKDDMPDVKAILAKMGVEM